MLLRVPNVITGEEVAAIRARIDGARWVDGNVTSGHQSAAAKYNEQLPEDSVEARESGEKILAALGKSPLFFSAALPKHVYPPLFNRYKGEMQFGNHVDGAMRVHASTGRRIRTDISATLFLTASERLRRRRTVDRRHLRRALGQAACGRYGHLSSHEFASSQPGHTRCARRIVLLDRKHDPRRRAPFTAV